MGTYVDDERQSSRPPGPRPAGLAANAPSAASQRFNGSTDPVFAAPSCIRRLCGQSILIFGCDRAPVRSQQNGRVGEESWCLRVAKLKQSLIQSMI